MNNSYYFISDEVVNNTHQKDYDNGYQTCVTRKLQEACIPCATDEFHFTVLFWTTSSAKVVMLSIIFIDEQLKV